MVVWVLVALASPLCSSHALGELPEVPVQTERSVEPTRCLERGTPRETLLQRARRCVVEVPDDPAHVRVLGALGGKRDVPVLEALGTAGWHAEAVAEALAFMEHPSAREALVRVACRAELWTPAVDALMREPRAEELDLYLELLAKRSSSASRAVGRVGDPRGRAALIARGDRRGLAQDPHPDAVAALEPLLADRREAVYVLRSMPAEHPLYVSLLERLWEEPSLRMYLAELSWALPGDAAFPHLERALQDVGPGAQRRLGMSLQQEPDRFPALVERIRREGPPHALVGLVQHDPEEQDTLWALVDDPVAGWAAATELLRKRDLDPARRDSLAERVLAEAPEEEKQARAAAAAVSQPGRRPIWTRLRYGIPDGVDASRARSPLRDSDMLRDAVLASREAGDWRQRHRTKTLGPWVWDGPEDLQRLRAFMDFWVLADAADAVGFGLLGEWRPHDDHRRASRRWAEGTPEAAPSRPTTAELLPLLADGVLPSNDNELVAMAVHHGQRWRLLEVLDDLSDADQARALQALLQADWRRQPPPKVVVEAARSAEPRRGAHVMAVVGDGVTLGAWMGSDRRHVFSPLFEVVTTMTDPPEASVALVAADVAARPLQPNQLKEAWRVPALRSALAVDACGTVVLAEQGVEVGDEDLLEAIRSCGRAPGLSTGQGARLQGSLLASGDVAPALQVASPSAELLEALLPDHPLMVLKAYRPSHGPSDGSWPVLEEWLRTWDASHREAFQVLTRVYDLHRPAECARILRERVASQNDELVIDTWLGRSQDDLEVLIPVVQRGGPQAERVALRIRGVSKEVYARHRALIDAELSPTWEVRP